jgi:hypothetical protein
VVRTLLLVLVATVSVPQVAQAQPSSVAVPPRWIQEDASLASALPKRAKAVRES